MDADRVPDSNLDAFRGFPEEAPAAPPPLPAPEVPAPDRDAPGPGGYLDFLLDERLGPPSPAPSPPLKETVGASKAPVLEPAARPAPMVPPPSLAPVDQDQQKDPFAGWLADDDEVQSVPAEENTPADAEVTAPTTAPRKVPEAPAPVSARKIISGRKKSGPPKALILSAAGALLVVIAAIAWFASRPSKPAEREPTIVLVPGGPLSPAPATPRPQMAAPQLAAPDPQYTSGDKSAPKPPAAQPGEPGGLQGRPAAAPAGGSTDKTGASRPNGTKQAQIIATQRQAFDECTAQAASRNPELRKGNKKATLIVTVVPSGDITAVRLDDPNLDEPQLNACLKRAARRMSFPAFEGAPLLVDVPLSFGK